jgi:hypothetical protein
VAPNEEPITLSVEIADEPQERSRGLMERKSLPENHGMLFLFPEEQELSFWMKNTLIPLDILFFDHRGVFVSSHSMEPCRGDPCPLYGSDAPASMALEVPQGSLDEHGVGSGWRIMRGA